MDEIVKLCDANSGPEAAIVESILIGAGIRYMIDPNNPIITRKLWGYVTSYDTTMGPIEFYVHRDDYDRAREMLDTISSGNE